MAHEKLYTAKQAAIAVLKKTQEVFAKSELSKAETGHERGIVTQKSKPMFDPSGFGGLPKASVTQKEEHKKVLGEMKTMPKPNLGKAETENPKKENAKPSEHNSQDADQHAHGKAPKGEIHPTEKEQAPPDAVMGQKAPEANPAEAKEGNNEPWGTDPGVHGHIKLAKFIGHMESKRKAKMENTNPAMNKAEDSDKHYNYYLVHNKTGQLHGGNEYKQDAVDASKDHAVPASELKVTHRTKVGPEIKEKFHKENKIMGKLLR